MSNTAEIPGECEEISACLNAYADDELPDDQRRTVDRHIVNCGPCRERCEEITATGALLRNALPVPPPPDDLAARIVAEARRRRPADVAGRPAFFTAWNPCRWLTELSTAMRLAACVTVFLALGTGLSLTGGPVNGGHRPAAPAQKLYGLEWFSPVLPGSIGSIYISIAED
ncbi:anti-sigma factor family protein [Desulfobacterota bacterium M19]